MSSAPTELQQNFVEQVVTPQRGQLATRWVNERHIQRSSNWPQ